MYFYRSLMIMTLSWRWWIYFLINMSLLCPPQQVAQSKKFPSYSLRMCWNIRTYQGISLGINIQFTKKIGGSWSTYILGMELHFSTSFQMQTDGQMKWVNILLKCYLRHYVNANQKTWARLLNIAQFSYNLHHSESTRQTLFELAAGSRYALSSSIIKSFSRIKRFISIWNSHKLFE